MMGLRALLLSGLATTSWAAAASSVNVQNDASGLSACPGYKASNVQKTSTGLKADLSLAAKACNVYGDDLENLTLTVEYQTDSRLHVIIQDAAQQVYQVPSSVFTRPTQEDGTKKASELEFKHVNNPFSFSIVRRSSGEVLFDSSAASLIFESQYLRLRTPLPQNPSLYGLGEHTDPFMLNSTNYTRTIWNRDAYEIPPGTNLYGDHPIYFDHRGSNGTHGVFLLNSNGMNINIDDNDGQYLEYNILGGVLDFYFLAGPSPVQVAEQYSSVVGKSAMMPYWGFGFHQCRYGMQDVYEVAGVVHNYSAADIPLETMWTDIDYMDLRRVFSLDPDRFPLKKMRQLVDYLHDHQQHYIVMVDPAVAYQTEDYAPWTNGLAADAFLKKANGSVYHGVVWPGVTEFPDWFAPGTQDYWNGEFASFFDANTGVDIDALWIDMNEASNFCVYPCTDPEAQAAEMGDPPVPPAIRLSSPIELPGFPKDFQPVCNVTVNFNVNASTFYGENIAVLGSSFTLGSGNVWNSAPMSADNYPIWSVSVEMLPNTKATYQYVRIEPGETYVYEKHNRTIEAGSKCGSSQTVHDNITTSSPPQTSSKSKREIPVSLPQEDEIDRRENSANGDMKGLSGRNLINPPYTINNAAGSLSNKTINTNIMHANGLVEYDTHNLYGAMMSETSRLAMLSRRPTLRPMVITRSTFAGSGRQVGHWLGDNAATWYDYLISMSGLLEFGALFQVPMVGSDVCGYATTTNELLCARWAMLGAFSPFFRNHESSGLPPHEFYRWPLVAEAARNAISIRYRLLDYIYTAMYNQNQTGTPLVQPMFFAYPEDKNCNPISTQYLFGPGVMVAPVTEDNSTTTKVYLPHDIFYDWYSHDAVRGKGEWETLTNVNYTTIPLYYKGGSIIAQRSNSANTTTELRKQNFTVVVAPGLDGSATGSLYLDDGVSLEQPATSNIFFNYTSSGHFSMTGSFKYDAGVVVESIQVLSKSNKAGDSSKTGGLVKTIPLTEPFETDL